MGLNKKHQTEEIVSIIVSLKKNMALRIICPAYQPMDVCSPFSLFGGNMRPYPCMRKPRRVMDSADFIDKIFGEMFLPQPSYEPACSKRGAEECCRQQRTSSSKKEADSGAFTKQMMVSRSLKPEEIQIRVTKDKKSYCGGKARDEKR